MDNSQSIELYRFTRHRVGATLGVARNAGDGVPYGVPFDPCRRNAAGFPVPLASGNGTEAVPYGIISAMNKRLSSFDSLRSLRMTYLGGGTMPRPYGGPAKSRRGDPRGRPERRGRRSLRFSFRSMPPQSVGAIHESPAAAKRRDFRCRRHRGNGTGAVPYR